MMEQTTSSMTFFRDSLKVQVYADRKQMGLAAAVLVADQMRILLQKQERVRLIFAAAPSQNEFLDALGEAEGIEWERIDAFHMDEYVGLPESASQRFGLFLKRGLFDRVPLGNVHYINPSKDAEEECIRYTKLLTASPIDIVCMGIGENGHIAFNDPPVADFSDPVWMKRVELDEACREQQVNDGCFTSLDQVPTHALTLTIPALLSGKYIYCMVPGPLKRTAVTATLTGPIEPSCPASILRTHQGAILFLDEASYNSELGLGKD
ncbi:glucosamine-6-phosphate deaminase [Paenibacillus polygoni]|uniref:Glucosamine-6-phosphate deaminase n=1 Tax=Paenibacillus polygoni TaxID=3050112 RepID=A0ABY8X487_9BACL|nr:glucosamine-6-phosphate deaminase [Paenibacillus polygoni]WIV20347.1 glucosamine-6-phosphate deaminase [Paenibacillus polygoni]